MNAIKGGNKSFSEIKCLYLFDSLNRILVYLMSTCLRVKTIRRIKNVIPYDDILI